MSKTSPAIRFSAVNIVLVTLLFLFLTPTSTAAAPLVSGSTTLLDWDQSKQGFSFEYRGPASTKLDFFMADRQESLIIHVFESPGIIDMGRVPLDSITTAPGGGYRENVRPVEKHSYVIRSRGKYAKIYLREIIEANTAKGQYVTKLKFDWVLQPDGGRYFSSNSNLTTKKPGEANHNNTETEQSNTFFRDNFDDGSLNGWKTVKGNWKVEEGKLIQSSNYYEGNLIGGTYALIGSQGWSDYSVSARVMSKDDDKIGLVFRYVNANNFYILSWQQDWGNKMRFTKIANGKEEDLAITEIGYQKNKWYELKVAVAGNKMIAYLDGEKVLSARDGSLTQGRAGLYSHGNMGSYYDYFSVKNISGVFDNAWSDRDEDGVPDKLDACPGTPRAVRVNEQGCAIRAEVKMKTGKFGLEAGTIDLDSEWTKVTFEGKFTYPVVVTGPLSHRGIDPATVAIKNITSAGFEVRIQEWDYLDNNHTTERLGYLAVERGHFSLPGGLEIEADVISTNATGATKPETPAKTQLINFFAPFREKPLVFTNKVSSNGSEAAVIRASSVTPEKFNLIMQEEGSSDQQHTYETIAYIAISSGKGELDGSSYELNNVKASNKPANIELLSGDKIRIHVDEETSRDEETEHIAESVGYLIFENTSPVLIADMQTMDGLDPANLRYEKVDSKNTPVISAAYTCENDILEGKCGPFVGSHTYEFSSAYVQNVKALVDTGRGLNCRSEVTFSALVDNGWEIITRVEANSSQNGDQLASAEYSIPINRTIQGLKISDGCACCIDKSRIWLNVTGNTVENEPEKGFDTVQRTVTLKHWGGEGSFEEGYDFSASAVQRYGENGPDKPGLNPDFYYSGSWGRSFPTTEAHDGLSPLERIDYGVIDLLRINEVPRANDPRFEKGHLQVGHSYGFYSKEGDYVLLKVKKEEEIPRADWHVGALSFSWRLLAAKSSRSSAGCPIFIGGKWVETTGKCSGTVWNIITEGEKPEPGARAKCDNGYRGTWNSQNVSLNGCTMEFDLTESCTVCKNLYQNRTGTLVINYLNDDSARLILEDGSVVYLGRPK